MVEYRPALLKENHTTHKVHVNCIWHIWSQHVNILIVAQCRTSRERKKRKQTNKQTCNFVSVYHVTLESCLIWKCMVLSRWLQMVDKFKSAWRRKKKMQQFLKKCKKNDILATDKKPRLLANLQKLQTKIAFLVNVFFLFNFMPQTDTVNL